MDDVLGPAFPGTTLGYCTNVHAGATLERTKAELETHAVAVKQLISPDQPMGIGLWLCARAAREMLIKGEVDRFRDWLGERGLYVFTMNGFPYHDFHQPVVKRNVYHPDWSTKERRDYTCDLLNILAGLLPPHIPEAGVSTLPLGWWRNDHDADGCAAAVHLSDVTAEAQEIEHRSGKHIHVDIEPEPGCCLSTSTDLIRWYEQTLLRYARARDARRYVCVCHDVCHAAIMYEAQDDVLNAYAAAGIAVGKVQVSSALVARLAGLNSNQRAARMQALECFMEERYLHQVSIEHEQDREFFGDLPLAFDCYRDRWAEAGEEWRVHFHVPVYIQALDLLATTQADIAACLATPAVRNVRHFEVETYAWNVLPADLQRQTLAEGIADELKWVMNLARGITP